MIHVAAIGLTPCGSSTVHIYLQTIPRTPQSTQQYTEQQYSQIRDSVDRAPLFASYSMSCAIQLRKKHVNTSVRVAGEWQLAKHIQNGTCMSIRIHKYEIRTHNFQN
jgi:hypothetical protein